MGEELDVYVSGMDYYDDLYSGKKNICNDPIDIEISSNEDKSETRLLSEMKSLKQLLQLGIFSKDKVLEYAEQSINTYFNFNED